MENDWFNIIEKRRFGMNANVKILHQKPDDVEIATISKRTALYWCILENNQQQKLEYTLNELCLLFGSVFAFENWGIVKFGILK